jgi:pilus assembly protein CpaC
MYFRKAHINIISIIFLFCGSLSHSYAREVTSKPLNVIETEALSERISVEKGAFFSIEFDEAVKDLSIGDPEVMGANIIYPNIINIFGLSFGASKLAVLGEGGKVLKTIHIDVRRPVNAVQETIRRLIPSANIEVSSIGPSIILNGNVPSARESLDAERIARQFVDEDEEIINILEVRAIQQVLIKVRIAEMERSVLKTLGVSASAGGSSGTLTPVLGAGSGLAGEAFSTINVFRPSIGLVDDILISALEREGLVKTLAEPALTAISGETANFLAGGELPVPSGRDSTGNISIEFKTFGVALSFTPVVLSDKQISLRIKTEVSRINEELTLNLQGTSVKGLSVRRADSTVNLPSGGQIMIAGLLSNIDTAQFEGVPILKDIPILGALFRSAQFRGNKSELVVIVESYLVSTPIENSQMSTPVDYSKEITGFDFFVNNDLNRIEKRNPADQKEVLFKELTGE